MHIFVVFVIWYFSFGNKMLTEFLIKLPKRADVTEVYKVFVTVLFIISCCFESNVHFILIDTQIIGGALL